MIPKLETPQLMFFDQHPHFCHFVLHIAVNTNVSEGFVVTAIWSTFLEGTPADRFVLHIAVNTSLRSLLQDTRLRENIMALFRCAYQMEL